MPREKQDAVIFSVRLPPDLHAALKRAAESEDRSMNAQLVALLRAALLPAKRRAK